MYITTGLPHERTGGYTRALFAKPHIRFQKRSGHIVYVDCHIIIATEEGIGNYKFETTSSHLKLETTKKMHAYAKKIAKQYVEHRGWTFKKQPPKFVQTDARHGFHFFVNEK